MKTYSRKKLGENVEDEEIIDLDDVCRLCMEKEDDLISIFNNEEAVPLTLRILACVALEVSLVFCFYYLKYERTVSYMYRVLVNINIRTYR